MWEDLNRDGEQDDGEAGLPGVAVSLRTAALSLVDSTETDADGLFEFATVQARLYLVEETDPPGSVSTTSNVQRILVLPNMAFWVGFGDVWLPTLYLPLAVRK